MVRSVQRIVVGSSGSRPRIRIRVELPCGLNGNPVDSCFECASLTFGRYAGSVGGAQGSLARTYIVKSVNSEDAIPSQPESTLQRVGVICDAFESAWRG